MNPFVQVMPSGSRGSLEVADMERMAINPWAWPMQLGFDQAQPRIPAARLGGAVEVRLVVET
jgi:hypothetical protein